MAAGAEAGCAAFIEVVPLGIGFSQGQALFACTVAVGQTDGRDGRVGLAEVAGVAEIIERRNVAVIVVAAVGLAGKGVQGGGAQVVSHAAA